MTVAAPESVLDDREICVCVGCGGVGKTTIAAAALALDAAQRGRRALVLTIDPARRLADALGVEEIGNRPQALPREVLTDLGVPSEGELSAVMLDMKRTFDDLVERFAESPQVRERVFANPIYQHASDALAGSVEYSAMEKVFELHESGEYDLIVVDTPPAQHALDFLEAPQRLLEFLDSRLVQILIHPAFSAGRFGFRMFQRSTQKVLGVLERISGFGFLEDISEFLLAFEGMADGFRERARRVRALLLGDASSFVLVTGPRSESIQQATRFLERLEAHQVPLAGVVVNRIRLWPDGAPAEFSESDASGADLEILADALRAQQGADYPAAEAAQAAANAAKGYAAMVQRDAQSTRNLRTRIESRNGFWKRVPEFETDVHSVAGLARVADCIRSAESSEMVRVEQR